MAFTQIRLAIRRKQGIPTLDVDKTKEFVADMLNRFDDHYFAKQIDTSRPLGSDDLLKFSGIKDHAFNVMKEITACVHNADYFYSSETTDMELGCSAKMTAGLKAYPDIAPQIKQLQAIYSFVIKVAISVEDNKHISTERINRYAREASKAFSDPMQFLKVVSESLDRTRSPVVQAAVS